MAIHKISFDPQHAVEVILLIANKMPKPDIHGILKIIYFSDKLHLSEYGVTISGDQYVAMDFGPVASNSYNLIKAARGDLSTYINPLFYKIVDSSISVHSDQKSVHANREPRLEYLSESQIECLDTAIKSYGELSFDERTELSHDGAWTAAFSRKGDGVGASPMLASEIIGTLANSDEVLDYIKS